MPPRSSLHSATRRKTRRRGVIGVGGRRLRRLLAVRRSRFAAWAFDYPKAQTIPVARWISGFTKWLVNDATFGLFTFTDVTRFIAAVIDVPYKAVLSLLATGFMSGPGIERGADRCRRCRGSP